MISPLSKKHDFNIVFDSQKVFRLVLEAMSNPTRIVSIKESSDKLFGNNAALLAVAMTLLDNEVSFSVCEDQSLTNDIASLTLAKKDVTNTADFVFVDNPQYMESVIENVKCGTLSDPHKSATVVILNDDTSANQLTLWGPGINGRVDINTSQTVKNAIKLRDAQNYEYPQGIDLLFVTSGGDLLAIPRLTKMEAK